MRGPLQENSLLNSEQASAAANTRWSKYRAMTGETITEASVRLQKPFRTLKRWKASGKLVMQDKQWTERTVPLVIDPVFQTYKVSVKAPISPVTMPDDVEEIEDAAIRLNISVRTAYAMKESGELTLDNDGLWTIRERNMPPVTAQPAPVYVPKKEKPSTLEEALQDAIARGMIKE